MKILGVQSVASRAATRPALIGSAALLALIAAPAWAQTMPPAEEDGATVQTTPPDGDDAAPTQTTPPDEDAERSSEIVVTGSRLPASLQSYPGSVTRIDSADIEAFKSVSSDPAQLLGFLVPGLGTSVPGASSNFEQSLRGRAPAVLIDGVPIGTTLRDGRRDIRSLSLSVVDSVEVIRGASALYGNGGAGGVINFITKKGGAERRFESEAGAQASITHFSDSLAPFVRQSALGKVGPFDYNLEGYAEFTQGQFDAEGDRIRPSPNGQGGMADSSIYNLFAKIGADFDDQRIEGSVLYYKQEQDSEYNGIIRGDPDRRIKTRPFEAPPFPGTTNEGNKNFVANLVYTHSDLWGTKLRAQTFYQDFMNIFSFTPTGFVDGGQSQILSEKYGARLDLSTPFNLGRLISGGSILWGADFVNDTTIQNLVDGRDWSPLVTQESFAGFAQVTAPIGERLTLRGGFRYEDIAVSNVAFNTLRRRSTDVSIPIPAGQRSFTAKVFNFGASYDVAEWASVFAAYSQGFSTAELGRILRDTRVPLNLSSPTFAAVLNPQKVDNYEAGTRVKFDGFNIEAAAFLSKCNLCSTTGSDLRTARRPDETFGFEISIDAKPSEDTRWGASFTFVDGNQDIDFNGSFETPLPSNRVPPEKITAYVEHDFNDMWTLRVQALHSLARDQFGNLLPSTSAVGAAPVEGLTLVDASLRMDLKRRGVVSLGINNLFNENYFTIGSYLLSGPEIFSKGPGTTVRLTYRISY